MTKKENVNMETVLEMESVPSSAPKSLDVTSIQDAKSGKVSDIVVVGNGDMFRLLCKASSKSQGWMKSTKAMEIKDVGCLVQVTTQHNEYVAEALQFVPNVRIEEDENGGCKLVQNHQYQLGGVMASYIEEVHDNPPMPTNPNNRGIYQARGI
jgi:hypothetical protein